MVQLTMVVLVVHILGALLMLAVAVYALIARLKNSTAYYRVYAYTLAALFALLTISGVALSVLYARPVIAVCDNLAMYLLLFVVIELVLLRASATSEVTIRPLPIYASATGSSAYVALALLLGF